MQSKRRLNKLQSSSKTKTHKSSSKPITNLHNKIHSTVLNKSNNAENKDLLKLYEKAIKHSARKRAITTHNIKDNKRRNKKTENKTR